MIIYQVLPRLWGRGRFSDWDVPAFSYLKTLGITHVNCRARAEFVKQMLTSRVHFRDVYVTDAAGVATTYAGDGGIVVCF